MEGKSDKISGNAVKKTFSDYTELKIKGNAVNCTFLNCKYLTIKGNSVNCTFRDASLVKVKGNAVNCTFTRVNDAIVKGDMVNCTRDGRPFEKPAPPPPKRDRDEDEGEGNNVLQSVFKFLRKPEEKGEKRIVGRSFAMGGNSTMSITKDLQLKGSGTVQYLRYSDDTFEITGDFLSINGVRVSPGTYKITGPTSWAPVEASCIACGMERLALACSECQEPLYCSHECASDASWQEHILKSHPL